MLEEMMKGKSRASKSSPKLDVFTLKSVWSYVAGQCILRHNIVITATFVSLLTTDIFTKKRCIEFDCSFKLDDLE